MGGGIAGLATAWFLKDAGVSVTVLEASDRVGGKVRSEMFGDEALDVGPDTFLGRVPWATDLCRRLGLEDEAMSDALLARSKGRPAVDVEETELADEITARRSDHLGHIRDGPVL